MRILYASLIALSLGFTACNSAENNNEAATTTESSATEKGVAKIEWIETEKDLGTIAEGQKSEIVFRFKNVGDKPLVISNIVAQCGCTAPEPSKEPIMPGKEGSVKAIFDSQGRAGENTKQLTVHANTEPETSILTFKVFVAGKDGNSGVQPQSQPQPQPMPQMQQKSSTQPGHEGHNHD